MTVGASSHRRTWALFVSGAAALAVTMAALSVALLRNERRAHEASAEDAHAERLRSAAAAMDRWLGPVLAREAGRPQSDYAPYRAPRRVFSADLQGLPSGSVVEPSPLLGFSAETILLHFEWSPELGLRSPQAPAGRERELALASGLSPQMLQLADERLSSVASTIDVAALAAWAREQAPALPSGGVGSGNLGPVLETACLASDALREGPLAAGLVEDAGDASVGALMARWLGGAGLVLARDARAGEIRSVQGIVADWPALSRLLLEEGGKDLSGARLVPGQHAGGVQLATLPATLLADPAAAPLAAWTPLRTNLSIAWMGGLISLAAVGWSLRAGISHAERRARFAAAVSHELRTPLTTLRIHSELLAEGVVTDPAIRQEYLETMHAESGRLASLVENVLLHARIEQASGLGRVPLTVRQLVDSVAPVLRRRASEAGRPLAIDLDVDPSSSVDVNRDAVERVLLNLVDNACKHGAAPDEPTLTLEIRRRARFVDLQVRDLGPGIPRSLGSGAFEPFRRGEESGAPGAGLGLALSRSLARDMRGELSLVPSERGACLRLSLRLVTS